MGKRIDESNKDDDDAYALAPCVVGPLFITHFPRLCGPPSPTN